jgi:hypothetical protein
MKTKAKSPGAASKPAKSIEAPRPAVEWISARRAAEILGRPERVLIRLGVTRVLVMNRPGRSRPLFRRDQVLRLAEANGIDVSGY